MFQTAASTRHPLMSAVAGEDQHVWTQVLLTTNQPWFYASFSRKADEISMTETILLSLPPQVIDLLKRDGTDITVKQLMLVSPGHVNKTGTWKMDPLREIWRGRPSTENRNVFHYVLEDGRCCCEHKESIESPADDDFICVARRAMDNHWEYCEQSNSLPATPSRMGLRKAI